MVRVRVVVVVVLGVCSCMLVRWLWDILFLSFASWFEGSFFSSRLERDEWFGWVGLWGFVDGGGGVVSCVLFMMVDAGLVWFGLLLPFGEGGRRFLQWWVLSNLGVDLFGLG